MLPISGVNVVWPVPSHAIVFFVRNAAAECSLPRVMTMAITAEFRIKDKQGMAPVNAAQGGAAKSRVCSPTVRPVLASFTRKSSCTGWVAVSRVGSQTG